MRGGPFAESEPVQKVIMSFASLGFIAGLVVPGLDRRFGWSDMPAGIALAGDAVMLLGWIGIFKVFKVNSFTAATIGLAPGQHLVTTGPYAIVRHPMYATALPMIFGIPIALASWWGTLPVLAIVPILVWRMIDEERFLTRNLPGYAAYCAKVRYRLVPRIW
jgi:protein-S-isoprenylcysteine O-methyltransferase Ste14